MRPPSPTVHSPLLIDSLVTVTLTPSQSLSFFAGAVLFFLRHNTSISICLYLSSWNPWSPWFDEIFLPSLSTKTKHSFSLPGIPAQVFLYHNNLHYYTRHNHFIISHTHTQAGLCLFIYATVASRIFDNFYFTRLKKRWWGLSPFIFSPCFVKWNSLHWLVVNIHSILKGICYSTNPSSDFSFFLDCLLCLQLDTATLPRWLTALLTEKFFNACIIHEDAKKNEKNIFCFDCSEGICPHCTSLHCSHRLLQVILSIILQNSTNFWGQTNAPNLHL